MRQLDIISIDATLLDANMSLKPENKAFNPQLSEIIGSYIINLESSKERYSYIQKSVNSLELKVERIPAVNGYALPTTEINKKTDLRSYEQLMGCLPNLGTIGCSLSHFKTWETFLNSSFEYALIFEDDVSFDPTKLLATIEQLIQHNKLWDIASFNLEHGGTPLTIKNLSNNQKLVVYLTEVTFSGAYIINRKSAAKLLEKSLPIKMPLDYYFTRTWKLNLKFTGIEPRLVHQTFGNSDIYYTERLIDHKKSIFFKTRRATLQIQSYVIRFLYNLKIYITLKSKDWANNAVAIKKN